MAAGPDVSASADQRAACIPRSYPRTNRPIEAYQAPIPPFNRAAVHLMHAPAKEANPFLDMSTGCTRELEMRR